MKIDPRAFGLHTKEKIVVDVYNCAFNTSTDALCVSSKFFFLPDPNGTHQIKEEKAKSIPYFGCDLTVATLSNTKIDFVNQNCPNIKKCIVRTKILKK